MIQYRNMDSEENLQLHISVNMILSPNMDIQEVKKLIRQYAKRNSYKFLRQLMLNLNNYGLNM